MEALVEVNENDIIRVKKGDTAIVEVDAYLGDKFKGVVTEIANSASSTGVSVDQVTSFDVKVLLLRESYEHLITPTNPEPFRPGMSATVDIRTKTKEHVLSVPIQAVTTRKDTTGAGEEGEAEFAVEKEPKEVVFVVEKPLVLMREVKTGIQDDNFIEILSGITDEDLVVVAPYSAIAKKLQDSSHVEIVSRKELFSKKEK
jgi:HlyD family secretion protein